MRLIITGASGLLGLNLSFRASAQGHAVVGLVNSHPLKDAPFAVRRVDLLDHKAALRVIGAEQPEAIIHCAALANLNQAEQHPDLAEAINADVPGLLAGAASRWGVPFIHISTDAVFDGRVGGYHESDPTHPLSVYARTKLKGEERVLRQNPDAVIGRVVFYGWSLSGSRSLSEFFFNNLNQGNHIKGFVDTYFCPLYVEHLADTLLEMLAAGLKGVYHLVSPEHLSKYAFGVRLARQFRFDPDLIEPVEMAQGRDGAPRSLKLILDSGKIEKALGHALPSVDEGIALLHQRWLSGYPAELQALGG